MINLDFGLPLAAVDGERYTYRLANELVSSNVSLRELAPFEHSLTCGGEESLPGPDRFGSLPRHLVYQGAGWIGNAWRHVSCTAGPGGYRLDVHQVGEFGISADGRRIMQMGRHGSPARASVVETMLGPGLILALALEETWCCHASAVLAGQAAVLFLGESGSGKSTLAAYLDRNGPDGWQRLADDVLPLRATGHQPEVLPHFPQLKLAPQEQPGPIMPETLPLGAIYILAEHIAAEPRIERLDVQEASLALVRHTVAARLFDQELLAAHLSFCTHLVTTVPVKRLHYRRSLEALPRVGEVIAADLNG